ncbi:MAG: hypothetical protein WCS03_08915 [Bacteroidota bacterium]
MKRLIIGLIFPLLTFISAQSQNSLGKADDIQRLSIAAIVPKEAGEIPEGAGTVLENKLRQIVTQNGLGASEFGSRFAIVPGINILTKDITPTAPPLQAITVEIAFFIVDAETQTIFSQTSVEFKGVGQTDEKAMIQVIRNINPKMGQFKGLVEKGKEKIIEFYNSKCDVFLKKAQALASQRKYQEALYILSSVPDVCRECYDRSMDLSMEIYKQYDDYTCGQYLAAAKAAWANIDHDKAAENLAYITPDSKCYADAQALADEIKKKLLEDGKVWDFKIKRYNDAIDLEKQRLQTIRDIGVAYAEALAHDYYSSWGWLYH